MTEKSPLTSPPSDAGKEEARKLYEEVIAASKKSLKETRERMHIDQIKNEKKKEEAYEKFIKPIEEEITAKEAEMRRALGSAPAPKASEESDEIKLKRSWEKAHEEKRGKEKEAKEQKRKARVEKKGAAIKKFMSRISPQEPPVLFEQGKGKEEQKEREAGEQEQRDILQRKEREKGSQEAWAPRERAQEEDNQERFEILEVPEEEFAPPSRAATPPHLEEKDEKKEKWPGNVARAVDRAYNRFEEAKHDKNRLSRLRDLQASVERMVEAYQTAIQHEWPLLPDEESRLLQLKRDIENELEFMAEKAPTPPPSGKEAHEPQTPLEAGPLTGQAREEKIAAFRARREELAKKETGRRPYEISLELHDLSMAEYYNFDTKKIDEAIEEAKHIQGKESYQYKRGTIEMLGRVKALIEKEIGIALEPLAGKTKEDIIEDMKSPEGVPPLAEPEKEPEKAPQKSKEKQYTEKDSVEGWKHYIAKEEERMRKEKPLTSQGGAEEEKKEEPAKELATKEVKTEAPLEGDRNALKRKLFPEQFRKPDKKEEAQPAVEAPPAPEGAAQESPEMKAAVEELLGGEMAGNERAREVAARVYKEREAMLAKWPEILEHKRAQERQLPEETGRVRRWLGIGGGRRALRFAASQETPEIHLERLESEKAYNSAREEFIRTAIGEMRKEGRSETDITGKLLELDQAETLRMLELKEQSSPQEWVGRLTKMAQTYNRAFEWPLEKLGIDKKHARNVRIITSAALMTGVGFASGALAGGAIAIYAGRRVAMPYVMSTLNGLGTLGINLSSERVLSNQLGRLRGERREALNQTLEGNNRAEALQESLREQRAQFSDRAKAIMERRRMFKRTAQGALIVGNILLASTTAHAFTSAGEVAGLPDESPVGPHIAIEEDSFRARIDAAFDRLQKAGKGSIESMDRLIKRIEEYTGGKPSVEVVEDVIGKGGAGGVVEAARKASEAAGETAPSGSDITPEVAEILTDEQREEALKQYYGLVESAEKDRLAYLEKSLRYAPSDEWREEALKRYYGLVEAAEADRPPSLMTPEQAAELHELQEKGVLTDEQIETLKRNWEGSPPLLDAEEIEKLQALREKGVLSQEQIDNMRKAWEGKLDALGKEPMATIGKSGNIWEASRSLIGEGEGKISKEQWLEAWEKSGLADKGFVKPGATVRFDAAEGLLKISEAKDNEFLYQALQKEGKPIPGWLEDMRDAKEGRPSVADIVDKSAIRALARPAALPGEVLETPVAGAKGGTFEQLLQDKAAQEYYVNSFGKHSFDQQEALLAEFKNAAGRLEENIKGDIHSSVRAAYEQEVAQTNSFINRLENNAGYQGNIRAWEALEKEWGREVGVNETQFAELNNKWSVERFLDTAKKIENRDFVPSDPLSKVLEARRLGTLEMAEKIQSKLPDRSALKMPLGRFLKNTL